MADGASDGSAPAAAAESAPAEPAGWASGHPLSRAIAVVAGLAVLLVVGCGAVQRSEAGEIVEAGSLSVFSFRAGDCFNGLVHGELESVEAIPCDQPHEAEVFLLVDYAEGADAPFPGMVALLQFGEDRCMGGSGPTLASPTNVRRSIYSNWSGSRAVGS